MIEFPKIPSSKGFQHSHCYAFNKLGGTNIGVEWSRKKGFNKFRLRSGLFDKSHETFGPAIPLFLEKYNESLNKLFFDNKIFRGIRNITVFGEFYGPSTFAGNHYNLPPNEKRDVII